MELYVWYRRPTFKCEDAINANTIFWRINKPLVKPVFLAASGKLGRFEYKLVDFIVSDTYKKTYLANFFHFLLSSNLTTS